MASFLPTADVANSRFDNDLSEDLIRGSPLWTTVSCVGDWECEPATFEDE